MFFRNLFRAEVDPPRSPQPTERLAVIGELPDGPELRALAGVAPCHAERTRASDDERSAQARLAQLIDDGSVDVAALSLETRGTGAWLAITALCKDPELLRAALAAIDDAGQIAFLVVHGATNRIRQLAAEMVRDTNQLRELSKHVRDKDKSVFKILKQKLDVLQAQEREAAEAAAEIDSICTALDRHSHRSFDPLYTGVFEHHHHRWLALTVRPDGTQGRRAADAIVRCQEVIEQHARQLALVAQREAALLDVRETQRAAAAQAEAAAAVQAEARILNEAAAAAARAAADAGRAERLIAEQQVLRNIGGLLRKANAALSAGQSQAAAGLRRAIEEKLLAAAAASASVPVHFTKSIQQLDQRLDELKQWKSFAVAPKRVELIRDMESLVGSTDEPRLLAKRIKTLQEDWKTVSKGIVSDDAEDWDRFHKASQAAYQPCREYFDAQSKLRQQNIKRREAVLERVRAFESNTHLEALDWRLVTGVLREAPLEWRSHSPVERDAGRMLQAEFDAAMVRLKAMLDVWYERNVSAKRALIEAARQLPSLEDGREAVDHVKRLQAQWKQTGPAARDQEQALWREFRECCDAVFKKRQQAYAEYAALQQAGTTQAEALCKEVEDSAAQTGPLLPEALAKVGDWRASFEALGELPRVEARSLQRRFEQAIVHLESQASRQQSREAQQSITDVFEAARRIRACEWAAMQNEPESVRVALRHEAEAFLTGIQRGPAGSNHALKEVLAKSDSAGNSDLQARETALRTLCIRCEILRDAPTPIEDQGLRRGYQVQRLMQGLGQGHVGNPDWNALLVEWIRVSAISPVEHAALQARFMNYWLQHASDMKRAAEAARTERRPSRARL